MKKEDLKNIKLFVVDMDGTLYLSDDVIDGAIDFIETAREKSSVLYFTNNSSRTRDTYVERLNRLGFPAKTEDILASTEVTMHYLREKHPNERIYILAVPSVKEYFINEGFNIVEEDADVVLVTFDQTLTYKKLVKACDFIRNGAAFLATHLDINCPVKGGFIPDVGSFCSLITKSTEKEAKFLGKPFRETLDFITDTTGFKKEEIAFIGDRIYTDVATGVNNGARGILVLSGETKQEDIEKFDVVPDLIFDSVKDMIKYL